MRSHSSDRSRSRSRSYRSPPARRNSPQARPPRKYCGTKAKLPAGYDRFGDRYECLRTGFGVATHSSKNKLNQFLALTNLTMQDIDEIIRDNRRVRVRFS